MSSLAISPNWLPRWRGRDLASLVVAVLGGAAMVYVAALPLPQPRPSGFVGPTLAPGAPLVVDGVAHRTLDLTGPIGDGAARTFADATSALAPGDVVLVSSPGGLVGQGLDMGSEARRRGLLVVVGQQGPEGLRPGRCFSACTLLLAGGTRRTVVSGSVVGIHAVGLVDGAGGDEAGRLKWSRKVYDYLEGMGVSPRAADIMSRNRSVVPLNWGQAATLGFVNRRPLAAGESARPVP